ncbi:unnamed protein product [Trichogramma brassicae]|uniref:Uncharacterized protein n=1 Tax=Trichogramma brassicae TaxID=86971 RepID=A0A6H5I3J1_9HYME|nr:unnamed protein product [Trichogramma brassicae]
MAPSSAALGAASVVAITTLLAFAGSVQAANLDLFGSFARGSPVRGLTGSLKSAIGKTQEIAGSAVNKTTSAVASEVKSVEKGVSKVADTIETTVDKTSDAVASTAEEAISTVKDKVDDFKEYVKDGIELNCLGFPKGPLTAALESILSSETKSDDVKFYFSTRRRPDYQAFSIANFTLRGSDFDIRRNTYVITHGFLSHGNEKWLADMKNSILNYSSVENQNAIAERGPERPSASDRSQSGRAHKRTRRLHDQAEREGRVVAGWCLDSQPGHRFGSGSALLPVEGSGTEADAGRRALRRHHTHERSDAAVLRAWIVGAISDSRGDLQPRPLVQVFHRVDRQRRE